MDLFLSIPGHGTMGLAMRVPLPEIAPPALSRLINGDLWSEWAEQGRVPALDRVRPAVKYVRLKPDGNCRLAVFKEKSGAAGAPPVGHLVRLFADPERARVSFEKERERWAGMYEPFYCQENRAMVLPFPADPELPALARLHEPRRFKRALTTALPLSTTEEWRVRGRSLRRELLAYKPGRRAVYRVDASLRHRESGQDRAFVVHAKLAAGETISRARTRLEAVCAARPESADWSVPQPLEASPGLLACAWVEGPSAGSLVRGADAAAARVLERAGSALAQLHALRPRWGESTGPGDEASRLRRVTTDLARILPDAGDRIRALGERVAGAISALGAEGTSPVHGDFHLDQILLSEHGVVLVDLDRAHVGRPAQDICRVLAHLFELRAPTGLRTAFLEGYGAVAELPSQAEARASEASHLLRRASIPLRSMDPDWPAEIERRVERARALVA